MRASSAWPRICRRSCASGSGCAGGDAQLPFDEVLAGDHLGDRVLDLQAGVHLHEVERAVLVGDEFDGAGADVADGLGGGDGGLAHLAAALGRHAGGGRFLQHLLVAALHRAVALEQVDAVAVRVGEDLDLDVARAGDVLLDQHLVVAEAGDRFALARGERVGEILAPFDQAHALAAAAGRRLDQHRVADPVCFGMEQGGRLVVAVVARRQRHVGGAHQLLGRRLRAHRADRRGRRADEDDAAGGAGVGEAGVLGQEAVAGVDRLRAGAPRGVEDALGDEVGFARRGRAEQHRLVGQPDVARVGVGLGIDGDGADAHAPGGLDDPAGDFSAVGNEDLGEHVDYSLIQPGGRLSRKAAMPSCASGVARRWAMRWAVSSTRLSLIG